MKFRREVHTANGGYAFQEPEDGDKWHLVKCLECGRENYAMNVSSGRCTWCGYNANADKKIRERE